MRAAHMRATRVQSLQKAHAEPPHGECTLAASCRRRAAWIADLLPNELAGAIAGMIDQGLAAMKKALERPATS
jgi:hypothetical protein